MYPGRIDKEAFIIYGSTWVGVWPGPGVWPGLAGWRVGGLAGWRVGGLAGIEKNQLTKRNHVQISSGIC